MDINSINSHFDCRNALTEGQYEMLVAAGRVFVTGAKLTTAQALTYIKPPTDAENASEREKLKRLCGYSDEQVDAIQEISAGNYGGHLITKKAGDFAEAKKWAEQRGFGETVKGRLGGCIPLDDAAAQRHAQLN